MDAISSLTDEEVDELLAGQVPEHHRDLIPLAAVATALRERVVDEPPPTIRYPLRHAMARRAAPAELVRPRRLVHAAFAGAAIVVAGLASAANALPAPVQDAVANVGDLVGVDVPRAGEDGPGELPSTPTGPAETAVAESGSGSDAGAGAPSYSTPGGATPTEPETVGDLESTSPAVPPEPEATDDEHGGGGADPDAADGENGRPGGSEGLDDGDLPDGAHHEGDDDDDGDDEDDDVDEALGPKVPPGIGNQRG